MNPLYFLIQQLYNNGQQTSPSQHNNEAAMPSAVFSIHYHLHWLFNNLSLSGPDKEESFTELIPVRIDD